MQSRKPWTKGSAQRRMVTQRRGGHLRTYAARAAGCISHRAQEKGYLYENVSLLKVSTLSHDF